MKALVIFGARSPLVVDFEETCFRAGVDIAAIISLDDGPRAMAMDLVVDLNDLSSFSRTAPFIACAFSPQRRQALVALAAEHGLQNADALIDPTAILARSTMVGAGSFINAGCVIGAVTRIGEHVLINRAASVGHHSMLEDFVTIGPGATLAGNIRVGHHSVIGAGSTILPDLRVGAGAVVAAGSVVRKHVADGTMVAGNPAVEKDFDINKSAINLPGGE